MNFDIIDLVITSVVTVFTAILTIYLPIRKLYTKERDADRIIPIVSILDDSVNDINNRLNNGEFGCFFDINDLKKYEKDSYFYFILSLDGETPVSDCKVLFNVSNGKDDSSARDYKIGSLGRKQKLLFPICKEKVTKILVVIEYRTTHNEYMRYELIIGCKDGSLLDERQESFYSLKHPQKFKFEDNIVVAYDNIEKRAKKIIRLNKKFEITKNYNSNEIFARLLYNELSLTKNEEYKKANDKK